MFWWPSPPEAIFDAVVRDDQWSEVEGDEGAKQMNSNSILREAYMTLFVQTLIKFCRLTFLGPNQFFFQHHPTRSIHPQTATPWTFFCLLAERLLGLRPTR